MMKKKIATASLGKGGFLVSLNKREREREGKTQTQTKTNVLIYSSTQKKLNL